MSHSPAPPVSHFLRTTLTDGGRRLLLERPSSPTSISLRSRMRPAECMWHPPPCAERISTFSPKGFSCSSASGSRQQSSSRSSS